MTSIDAPLQDALRHAFGGDARVTQLTNLIGDASTRLYQRAVLEGAPARSVIVMRLPADALSRSDEAAKATTGDELPFSNMLRAAQSRSIRVPGLYADLTRVGNFTVLLEDLGDETFFKHLGNTPRGEWPAWYARAVDLLVDWQNAFRGSDASCVAYGRRFDRDLLRWELDHFREWGLDAFRGEISSSMRKALDAEFDTLADEINGYPTTLVHRDWQSKNLMVLPEGKLAVIDFQDALVGPRPYDLVALLCDSYTALEATEQDSLVARYLDRAGVSDSAGRAEFTRQFYTQAVQRKLKDTGRFVFIDRVRKNPSFLQYMPQSVRYVNRALSRAPGRERLAALLAEAAPDWFGPEAPR